MTCMQAALIAWITIRLWTHFLAYNPPKEILKEMPTDVLIAEFYRAAAEASEKDEAVGRWGTAVQWNDLHASGPYRMDYD